MTSKKVSSLALMTAMVSVSYALVAAPAAFAKTDGVDDNPTLHPAATATTTTALGGELVHTTPGETVAQAATTAAAQTTSPVLQKDLQRNMRDEEVTVLQQELASAGLFDVEPTGFFGTITEKAVRAFQAEHGLAVTGVVDAATRTALNAEDKKAGATATADGQVTFAQMAKQISGLMETVKQLQVQVEEMRKQLGGQAVTTAGTTNTDVKKVDPAAQKAAGIIITGGVSGPGYPTGPLAVTLPASQLLLDREGQVNGTQVKDRQYETALGTITPVTINGVANNATEVKVISNMKTKDGVGQHQGTIDIDIDTVPLGHVTLAYSGTATVTGSTIASKGTFKTTNATGIFNGLVAEGTYDMTIVETGSTFGSPATVTLTTVTP